MTEEKFVSFDNSELHMYVFDDVKNPKGVVQIIHGMQESTKTYFEFASFLNQNGYVAIGMDLRSHGKTAKDLSQIGVCKEKLFENIVKDELLLSEKIKNEYNLPLIVFGHSYGSFILQRYLQLSNSYDKAILSGSAHMKTTLIKFGKLMSSFFCAFGGAHKKAKLIESMSFKNYQKQFNSGCWITSDEQKAQEFYDDEMNALPFENAFYKDMFCNQLKLYNKNNLKKINKQKPILIASGEQDPVGEFSKSTKKLFEVYKNIGLNVELKLYPNCRHGIVQEKNRKEIMNQLLEFITK